MIWIYASILLIVGVYLGYRSLPYLLDIAIEKSEKRGFFNGPWKTHLGVGLRNTNAIEKAAIARIGLGANTAEETVYWNVFTDSSGEPLSTDRSYEVVLNSEIPIRYEEKGFWSITAYGEDQFLMDTGYKKYMIRHEEMEGPPPHRILISSRPNPDYKHWIPLTKEKQRFTMAMRCYRAKSEMITYGTAKDVSLPSIERIE